MNNWVALLPITLTDTEKRCLETIEQLGSYTSGSGPEGDPEGLEALEEREFLRARRDHGALTYEPTETGKLWLQRCTEPTGKYTLADDLTALFNWV